MGLAQEYIDRLIGEERVAIISAIRLSFQEFRLHNNKVRNAHELKEHLIHVIEHISESINWQVPPESIWDEITQIARRRVGDFENWLPLAADGLHGGLHGVLSDVMKDFESGFLQKRENFILSEIDHAPLETKVEIATELYEMFKLLTPGTIKSPAEIAYKCSENLSKVARLIDKTRETFCLY